MSKKLSYSEWVSEYCRTNACIPLAIDGVTHTLWISNNPTGRYGSAEEWAEANGLALNATTKLALEALWEVISDRDADKAKAPKKSEKVKATVEVSTTDELGSGVTREM